MKAGCLLICLLTCYGLVLAQTNNGELYRQLWINHLDTAHYQRISGQVLDMYFPDYEPDTNSQKRLVVLNPQVQYELLADKRIKRSLEVPYNVRDSVSQSLRLLAQDTLSQEAFKRIHRQSRDVLRGESPTIAARWIRPVALLTLSVAGILSLFYIRS